MPNPNLVKSNYASQKPAARVIDNNARAEERILAAQQEWLRHKQEQEAKLEEPFEGFSDDFAEGLNAEQLDMLTGEQNIYGSPEDGDYIPDGADIPEDAGRFDPAMMEEEVPPPPMPQAPPPVIHEEPSEEAQEILEDAQAQAAQIIADAKESAAQLTALAHEQGFSKGLEEGRIKGEGDARAALEAEFEERHRELEAEYQKSLDEVEPEMVDTLTRIYEHVFDVNLREEKKVILHLLRTTLSRIEPGGDFMIHVSSSDYDRVFDEKETLKEYITAPNAMLEVVEDPLLHENECMIETDGGIFDCSVGVELSELTRKLRLLAFDRRGK